MNARGFTLVECLIGAAISLFVVCAAMEFMVSAQRRFHDLKTRMEASQGAQAALDKMRIDLLHAGRGLAGPLAAGLVEAVEADEEGLRTASSGAVLVLAADARAGDSRLVLASTEGLGPGREICLLDGPAGEVRTISRVEPPAVILREPLSNDYSPVTGSASLLERVAYFLDRPSGILRRRANGGPAQPALEDIAEAVWRREPGTALVRVRLELNAKGVLPHGMSVLVKNAALAAAGR